MGTSPEERGPHGPLPLCIGITGHRDLLPGDEPHLKTVLAKSFLDHLARTPHTRLHILSALAEGADLLAAEVALELATAGHPVVLRAVLPMPWPEYARDFPPAVRARVEAVLQGLPPGDRLEPSAEDLIARWNLPARPGEGLPAIEGERRVDCYEDVGRRIARHCHLLLALWDGREAQERAGTAQIVAERQAGIPVDERAVSRVFRDEDRGPVLVVPVGRRKHDDPPCREPPRLLREKLEDEATVPDDDSAAAHRSFDERLAEIEAFNRAAAGLDEPQCAASRQWLMAGLRPARSDTGWTALEAAYVAADVLASRHQRRNHAARQTILALALLIPTLAVFGGQLPGWMGLGYPLLFVGMLVAANWNRRQRHHDRSLLYRALAEALRVQLAWRLAGSDEQASRHYLRRHQAALGWMGTSLRCLCLQRPPAAPSAATNDTLRTLGKAWLADQHDYHEKTAVRHERRASALNRFATVLVALALCIALTLGLLPDHAAQLVGEPSRGMLAAFAGSLPALAGCLLAYNAAMAHREMARESQRMTRLHARAGAALESALAGTSGSPDAMALVNEVGIECLRENAEWVFLHHDRPPEVKLD